MSVLRSIVMAFSLFSRIPMPQVDWSEHNRRFMMAAFPAVGALIGACLWGWWQLSSLLGFGAILRAAGLTLIPLGITGGMHLDGLADVVDARSSYAEPAKRREILKDPHVGAFAVMGVCGYLITYLSLASEVNPRFLVSLICAPILSRCLSGYATITFKKASTDGMLAAEGSTSAAAAVRLVLLGVFGLTACIMVIRDGFVGAGAALAAVVELAWVKRTATREFGGMGGDLAGYYLQMAELLMLACIVIVGRLVTL